MERVIASWKIDVSFGVSIVDYDPLLALACQRLDVELVLSLLEDLDATLVEV